MPIFFGESVYLQVTVSTLITLTKIFDGAQVSFIGQYLYIYLSIWPRSVLGDS